MKKLIYSLTIVMMIFAMTNTTKAEDIFAGGGLIYGSDAGGDGEIGIDVRGIYMIDDKMGVSANVHYFLVEDPISFYTIDANFQYHFLNQGNTRVYGLAGLDYAVVDVTVDTGFGGSFSSSASEIGLNIGGGARFDFGGFSLNPEAKFVLSDADQLVISVSAIFPL